MGSGNSFKRNAGILMAISSLPSPYGIGTLGKDAYDFVNFVRDTNHKYWQVLPVLPIITQDFRSVLQPMVTVHTSHIQHLQVIHIL